MLASGFTVSSNLDYEGYHKNTDEMPSLQGPIRYGPHPNVEIAFVIITADNVLHMLLELQFKCSVTGEGVSQAVEDKVSQNTEQAANLSQDGVMSLGLWFFFFLLWPPISTELDIFILVFLQGFKLKLVTRDL